jgi:hypothetical protein
MLRLPYWEAGATTLKVSVSYPSLQQPIVETALIVCEPVEIELRVG